jgi:hypothetical protein
VEACFRYWRRRGFPHYSLNAYEMVREYDCLQAVPKDRNFSGDEIQMSMIGVKLANYFHPQMWAVKTKRSRTPFKCFHDDAALRKLIRKAFGILDDRYAVNESNLRRMLATFSHTARVSNFRPTAAKAIYERYSRNGDTVVDFSAGYGGRMLGCLPLDRRYIGIDPCFDQIKGLRRMKTKLARLVRPRARTFIHHTCAEDFLPTLPKNSVQLVFSSPPYFDTERYSAEKSQSYLRFPLYGRWLDEFLGKILFESKRILSRGGYLVVNVANIDGHMLADDTLRLATKYLTLTDTLKLRLGNRPYLRENPALAYRYEPVFVFRKD